MTASTFFYLLALSFISSPLVSSVPLNKGNGGTIEIAYGSVVDSAIAKSSYPFMARIILDGSFKCGGALISDRFVATARHCLEFCPCFNEANPSNDWTRCNKLCILKLRESSDFISDTETVHIIKTIHLPENSGKPYDSRGQRTDFALIELAESANTCTQEETSQGRCWPVTPVRLPDPFIHIKEGQRVRTLGWGATEISFGDEQSEFLAQLDITVNSSTLYHFLIETNIGPNGADPCKGDSGGPLLLRGDDLEWTLVGTLVGGGYACENPEGRDSTSDWNKLNLHVSWITSVIGTITVDKPVTSVTTVEKPVNDTVALLTGGRIGGTYYTESEVVGVTGCSIPPLAAKRIAHMTFRTYDGTFLTCGGAGVFPRDCQSWSPGQSDWAPHSTMISNRQFSSAVVLASGTYVIGGSYTNLENEMLPTGSNTWQEFSVTPIALHSIYSGCAVDIGPTRFLIVDQDNVQEYNTEQETWTVWPGLTQSRIVHSCARLGNKVVVAGGSNNGYLTSTEVIDIIDKTVTTGGNLHEARGYFGMAAVTWPPGAGEQRIIAFGGSMYYGTPSTRVDYDSVEVWTGLEWEQSNTTLTTPKYSFGFTAIPAQFCA